MNRVKKIGRQHRNGDKPMQSATAVVVDEAIEVTGPVGPAVGVFHGLRCELTTDCRLLVTHQVPVRVDGRDGAVFGCEAHCVAWLAAGSEADDGA